MQENLNINTTSEFISEISTFKNSKAGFKFWDIKQSWRRLAWIEVNWVSFILAFRIAFVRGIIPLAGISLSTRHWVN
jgi:hypothetical protein